MEGAVEAGGRRGLTRSVFADLGLRMVALGFATGIVFPFFVMALGVDPAQAITLWFFGATVAAGLMVGGVNFLLCRLVVGLRRRAVPAAAGLRRRSSAAMLLIDLLGAANCSTRASPTTSPMSSAATAYRLSCWSSRSPRRRSWSTRCACSTSVSRLRELGISPTIDLARNLGLRVVAGGVESQRALDQLADADCDLAQGYHLSPPLAAAELNAWLEDRVSAGLWVPARLSRAGSA